MYDHSLLLETLSGFAGNLVRDYDVDTVLTELTERVTAVFGLLGSGVSVRQNDALLYLTAVNPAAAELEQVQQDSRQGPCFEAYNTGTPVIVPDLRRAAERWPLYAAAAARSGITGAAGIPLKLADASVGALNLYSAETRDWSPEDITAAQLLADIATSYLVNASKLDQQRQLNEQLQQALDSRVVIEQAKGIIAKTHGTSVEVAFQRIRRHARNHNTSIRTVAQAIVNAGLTV